MDTSDILKSFESQDELNPKIWEKDGKSYMMRPEVREKLLETASLSVSSNLFWEVSCFWFGSKIIFSLWMTWPSKSRVMISPGKT